MMPAAKHGLASEERQAVELTTEERAVEEELRGTWKAILNIDILNDTDFFKAGAGSMDVVRYPTCLAFLNSALNYILTVS